MHSTKGNKFDQSLSGKIGFRAIGYANSIVFGQKTPQSTH